MKEPNPPTIDTLPEMTFMDVVTALGAKTVSQVFAHARSEQKIGAGDGVTFSSKNETVTLTVIGDSDVNFMFGGLGPYVLGIEKAEALIAEHSRQRGEPTAA